MTLYTVHNVVESCINCSYHPIPIVFSQAKGAAVWDPEGNKYIDCLSGYSAVNQVKIEWILVVPKALDLEFTSERCPDEYIVVIYIFPFPF